jgi:hypothetical protein
MVNNTQHAANTLPSLVNTNFQSQIGSNAVVHVSVDSTFKVCHQNIRGLRDKTNELINLLLPELPQILCITEHHLKKHELERILINHCNLGPKIL